MGRIDRPKGILKTGGDTKIIPFRQEASYYSSKGIYYSQKNKLGKALLHLRKAVEAEPKDPLNHYNLACLLSKAGRLEDANHIFKHIIRNMDRELTECYFFMAVNYGLMDDLEEAKRCLIKYLHVDPEGDMSDEAEDLLLAMEEEEFDTDGDCSLSTEENEAMLQLVNEMNAVTFRERLLEEDEFRNFLQRGLYQGSDILKEAIIRLYGSADCEVARFELAAFVRNPWIKERLRQVALLELKKTAPGGRYRIFNKGSFREVSLEAHPLPAPVWEGDWQEVLECTFANMRCSSYYSKEFFDDVRAIWIDFINHCYPRGPRVGKPQTWAAGLEYCLGRFHFLGLTQKELAASYGVSPASVQRKFQEINRVLQIDRKAYRNMLDLLADSEGEQL